MEKQIIKCFMLVTSIRPQLNSVSVSGTYDKQQRTAEFPDFNNIPRVGDLIQMNGTLVQGERRRVLMVKSWKLTPATAANIFEFIKRAKAFKSVLNNRQLKALHKAYFAFPRRLIAAMSGNRTAELERVVSCCITAAKLEGAWTVHLRELKAVHYLSEYSLNPQEALTMVDLHHLTVIEVVEANPYALMPVIGFERVDAICMKKGGDEFDPQRLAALGGWLARKQTQETGSSLLSEHDFSIGAQEYGVDTRSIIYESKRSGVLIVNGECITSACYHEMETRIRTYLTQVERLPCVMFHDYEIDTEISLFNRIGIFPLHEQQALAVRLAMHHPITCIQGAAGVGKTEVINAISTINKSLTGTSVTATALSSIAVDRIKQATGLEECYTIAKLKSDCMLKKLDIKAGTILVIDESSMLSVQDLYVLCNLGLRDVRIVFVGDTNQLEPIGYGSFFKQATQYFPTTTLTKVWRTEAKEITFAANTILNGERPNAQGAFGYIKRQINEIVSYAHEENAQVIAATNSTVAKINTEIQTAKYCTSAVPDLSIMSTPFYRGDRVIFTRNLNGLGIYNGQFAKFVWAKNNELVFNIETASGKYSEKIISYHQAANAGIKLGYACTGHKSQGAGFDKVVAVMENIPMCNKNWAYTAITRAKNEVRVAEITRLETVMNQPIQQRMTQRMVPLVS